MAREIREQELEFETSDLGTDKITLIVKEINGFLEFFFFDSEDTFSTFKIEVYSQKHPQLVLFSNEQIRAPAFLPVRYQGIDAKGQPFSYSVEKIGLNEVLEIVVLGPPKTKCKLLMRWSEV